MQRELNALNVKVKKCNQAWVNSESWPVDLRLSPQRSPKPRPLIPVSAKYSHLGRCPSPVRRRDRRMGKWWRQSIAGRCKRVDRGGASQKPRTGVCPSSQATPKLPAWCCGTEDGRVDLAYALPNTHESIHYISSSPSSWSAKLNWIDDMEQL